MNRCTSFLVAVLFCALVGCDSTPPPAQEPSTPKVEPAPPKVEPAPPAAQPEPPKAEPAPPKTEPAPPKAEPAPPKAEPAPPTPQPEPPKAEPAPPKPEPPKAEPPKPEPPKVEPPKAEPAKPPAPPTHKYMGTATCKMCHQKDTEGRQFAIWAESKHAQAWKALGTDEAKKLAAAKGVAGDPQQAPECLKCHVTGYGAPAEFVGPKFDLKEGVQCEACHGPGGDYWKKDVMKDEAKAKSLGLVKPDEALCKTCHNPESPSYKEFKFEEFLSKIAHPVPVAKK